VLLLRRVQAFFEEAPHRGPPRYPTQWAEYIERENEVLEEQDNFDGYAPWDDHVISCPTRPSSQN